MPHLPRYTADIIYTVRFGVRRDISHIEVRDTVTGEVVATCEDIQIAERIARLLNVAKPVVFNHRFEWRTLQPLFEVIEPCLEDVSDTSTSNSKSLLDAPWGRSSTTLRGRFALAWERFAQMIQCLTWTRGP